MNVTFAEDDYGSYTQNKCGKALIKQNWELLYHVWH